MSKGKRTLGGRSRASPSHLRGWLEKQTLEGDSRGPADHPVLLSDAAAFGFLSSHSPRLLEYSPQDF